MERLALLCSNPVSSRLGLWSNLILGLVGFIRIEDRQILVGAFLDVGDYVEGLIKGVDEVLGADYFYRTDPFQDLHYMFLHPDENHSGPAHLAFFHRLLQGEGPGLIYERNIVEAQDKIFDGGKFLDGVVEILDLSEK